MPYDDTPFDQRLHNDVAARRTTPTAQTVRIGNETNTTEATPVATSSTPSIDSQLLSMDKVLDASPKEHTPLPVIIAVAMALGAICVMGGSLIIRRIVPDTKPAFTNNTITSPGNEIMNPDLVIQNPQEETANETPSVEVNDVPNSEAAPSSEKPAETPPVSTAPAETYATSDFEVTPPGGFTLSQSGRRTIWKHGNGAQILVETGKAGEGSPRSGWIRLERDLKKRYGDRYKSLGISDGQLAGQPAAIWEFELTGKDGITRRKIDIGIQHKGRGYAILGSAPKENFDAVFPQIRAAVDSFKLKEKPTEATPEPTAVPSPTEIKVEDRPKPKRKNKYPPAENQNSDSSPRPVPDEPVHQLPEPKPTKERGF